VGGERDVFSAGVLLLAPLPAWSKVAVPALMAAVALWLWRRPEQ
jgi:hypothetical protein